MAELIAAKRLIRRPVWAGSDSCMVRHCGGMVEDAAGPLIGRTLIQSMPWGKSLAMNFCFKFVLQHKDLDIRPDSDSSIAVTVVGYLHSFV